MDRMTEPAAPDTPILVFGDDGSDPSDLAWRWLNAHEWPGWQVDVLTADPTEVKWGEPAAVNEWNPTWQREEAIAGAEVRFLKVATDPRAALAGRSDAALMVVGMRTHSYLKAMVTGSTTEWLLHHPPSPLVVVNSTNRVRSVTVCTDGSEHAATAYRAFASLPLAAGTEVTVLSVDDGRADTHRSIEEATSALTGKVKAVRSDVVQGGATTSILRHLSQTPPDLVVLGTLGLTGWDRLRVGSTAAAVVRAAPCSSLIACDGIDQ